VEIDVFDVQGRRVASPVSGVWEAGAMMRCGTAARAVESWRPRASTSSGTAIPAARIAGPPSARADLSRGGQSSRFFSTESG
jgi:hypothetical protein